MCYKTGQLYLLLTVWGNTLDCFPLLMHNTGQRASFSTNSAVRAEFEHHLRTDNTAYQHNHSAANPSILRIAPALKLPITMCTD